MTEEEVMEDGGPKEYREGKVEIVSKGLFVLVLPF